MSSPLVQLGLWSFLPSTLTTLLLSSLEKTGFYRAPPPNDPARVKHHNLAFTAVIGAYLLWTLYEAIKGEPGLDGVNWYQLLGVRGNATDDELKKGYRTFARLYHPDRAGIESEAIFIIARKSYETLTDPVKRFAYDRFGPDVTAWKSCASRREYMMRGLTQGVGFYVVSGGFMAVISFLFLALLTSELSIILTPTASPALRILSTLFPARRQFQHIQLLHKLWTGSSLAFTQLAGIWSSPVIDEGARASLEALNRLALLVRANEMEAARLFHAQVDGVSAEAVPKIKAEMEQVLVDTTLRSHPQIKPAWVHALANPPSIRRTYLPTPSPEPENHFERARRIPLPPSPPPSPRIRPVDY